MTQEQAEALRRVQALEARARDAAGGDAAELRRQAAALRERYGLIDRPTADMTEDD